MYHLNENDFPSQIKINVAIKELRTSTSADSKKFLAEAHVMASVNNPFCVHLLGVCLSSPMQLISEFVPLGNLTSYMPRHRQSLTSRILLTWALQIAKGMVYLESLGIVHRDLAARNVLLQRHDLVSFEIWDLVPEFFIYSINVQNLIVRKHHFYLAVIDQKSLSESFGYDVSK